MSSSMATRFSAVALLSLFASPLPAQFVSRLEVVGGSHAGSHQITGTFEATPRVCTLTTDSSGTNVLVMTGKQAGAASGSLTSLTIRFKGSIRQQQSNVDASIALSFVADTPTASGNLHFGASRESGTAGSSSFTFTPNASGYDTFSSNFSGEVIENGQKITVTGTANCKGYNN